METAMPKLERPRRSDVTLGLGQVGRSRRELERLLERSRPWWKRRRRTIMFVVVFIAGVLANQTWHWLT